MALAVWLIAQFGPDVNLFTGPEWPAISRPSGPAFSVAPRPHWRLQPLRDRASRRIGGVQPGAIPVDHPRPT